ncbi:hypothetical protein CC86DRAFT_352624 [Ophiobolus disseminans]|uniref:Heterokaryon incompatibility domain-containing protein n=1 Tax=Ophiobolus disseminans TaxID=1469910 RepID=A0A6A6ZXK6_9PLEO|nr:hypothetical protein CC86DRAFT_352624 [Ophiobolus disseminans]
MQPWILKGTAMSGGVRFGVAEPGGPEIGKWYPPRLLDIASNPIRLVSRRDFKQCPPFAALSHCWGQESFLTLTTDNIESFHKDGFDFAQMPENFQNVVVIVRWLKIRYIWIDSLCIIQSGREAQFDWAEHSDSMQYVYSSCDSCFKERNTATIAPVCVMVDGEPNILIGKDHAIRGFRNAPIASRAWVLQERLLSRRILTFGPNQVFWECPETAGLNVCETFPGGLVPYGHNRGPFALPPNEPWDRLGEYVDPNTKPSAEDQHIWLDLIETYSECNLTRRHEDKFVAFSGIVMHMHSVFNPSPYIAGFFAFELPAALLWYVRWKAVPRSRPTPPSDFYRAPSWSWAATDSLIRCRRTRILAAQAEPPELVTYFSTLLGHHVQLPHRGMRFGQLSQAALQLKAPLILMTWTGAFPRTEYDQQHTVYEMPDIKYMDIGRAFFFDSEDDFNTPQDGVYFMPILGLENTGQVEGLIVRCTSPPASATVDTAPPPCYIRIGMVVLPADGHFNDVKALETSEFALL